MTEKDMKNSEFMAQILEKENSSSYQSVSEILKENKKHKNNKEIYSKMCIISLIYCVLASICIFVDIFVIVEKLVNSNLFYLNPFQSIAYLLVFYKFKGFELHKILNPQFYKTLDPHKFSFPLFQILFFINIIYFLLSFAFFLFFLDSLGNIVVVYFYFNLLPFVISLVMIIPYIKNIRMLSQEIKNRKLKNKTSKNYFLSMDYDIDFNSTKKEPNKNSATKQFRSHLPKHIINSENLISFEETINENKN